MREASDFFRHAPSNFALKADELKRLTAGLCNRKGKTMPLRLTKNYSVGIIYFILFILTIPAMNWVVMNVGTVCTKDGPCLIPVWPGLMAPSGVLMAGVALVLRDGLQSKLGVRWSLYAILIGAALSAVFSEPSLVIASVLAFFFSELADLVVYTPMRKKWPAWAIMASGLVGSFVDSAIFLSLAFGSVEYIFGQVLGKFWMSLAVALLIGYLHRRNLRAAEQQILSR